MISLRAGFMAAGLLLAAATGSIAQDAPEVVRYQLDNGLEVLLSPDHKVPKVGMTLVYRVGGMNEPAGRSGFAHLFEHLMFTGTAAYPKIDDTYSALGISNNAYTEEDRTTFVADALASALPVLLSVEADRMANLGGEVDQRELDLQRNVVKNEMRQNVLDVAGQRGGEAFRAALFPAPHPYAEAVIGSIADLDAAELTDVQAFFNTYYVPNNAILSLAGDFEVEDVKAMIAETFGLLPRGTEVTLPKAAAPEPVKVRIEMADQVPAPILMLGVVGPAIGNADAVALMIAGDMLGNYEYGVLRRTLVNTGLAISAGASWTAGRLGGRFVVSASAAPGVAPEVLEAALRKAVADFAASELDPVDVERTRRTVLLGRRLGLESMMGRAQMLAIGFDLFGEKSPFLADDPVLLRMTAEGVSEAFRRIVAAEALSVLEVVPGERGDFPSVLKASSGVAVPFETSARAQVEVPALAAGEPGTSALPKMETATLSNGIRVVHYQTPGSPLAIVGAAVSGGSGSDSPGQEGLISLTTSMLARGAGERNFEAFSKAAKDIGADVTSYGDFSQTIVSLSVPPETFGAGVQLLADAVLRPRFEDGEWAALKAEIGQGLMYRQLDPQSRAYLELEKLVFPVADGGPALQPTLDSVGPLTVADARAMHERLFQPEATTFYSVGPMPLAEVVAGLESGFGTWTGDGAGIAAVSFPPARFGQGIAVKVMPNPGGSQAIIMLARPGPGFDEPGMIETLTVSRVLGDGTNSRLNAVMREAKGYSYGVSADLWTNLRRDGLMMVSTAVEADKVGEAVADIRAGFAGLTGTPVTQEELDRTIMASVSATAGSVETSSRMFRLVMGAATMGLTAAELNGRLEEAIALKLPQLQQVADGLATIDRAVVVVAGDPATVLPQLAAIGLTDVSVVTPAE